MTDSMAGLPLLCGVLLLILIVYSFPVLVPGWRRKMKTKTAVRRATIAIWGLLSLLTWYGLLTGLVALMVSLFGNPDTFATHMGFVEYDVAVDYELWLRQAFPFRPCYTTLQEICDIADERMQAVAATVSIGTSLFFLGISFVLTLPSTVVLLYFSRPDTGAVYTRHKFRIQG